MQFSSKQCIFIQYPNLDTYLPQNFPRSFCPACETNYFSERSHCFFGSFDTIELSNSSGSFISSFSAMETIEYLPQLCKIENVHTVRDYPVIRLLLEHQEEALFRGLPREGETRYQKHLRWFSLTGF